MSSVNSVFHEGEIALQKRAGVAAQVATYAPRMIRDHMPNQHRDFYASLPLLFVGHSDEHGQLWASVLSGPAGFVQSPTDKALDINGIPLSGDPLGTSIQRSYDQGLPLDIGILGLQMETRRRNRMNGKIDGVNESGFSVVVGQSFGNCPQYIQTRALKPRSMAPSQGEKTTFFEFNDSLKHLISTADTFFVASSVAPTADKSRPANGVDMSHRGGKPGFVKIEGTSRLLIPDYMGNNMFNTLGNILVNPNVGLLFVDFETGDVVQLTGQATIHFDDKPDGFDGAERYWEFELKQGHILPQALPFEFEFDAYSPNTLMTGSWAQAESRQEAPESASEWRNVRVLRKERESNGITSFYFDLDDSRPAFKAGQFIKIRVEIDGTKHIRHYSVSSGPKDDFFRISVKRDGEVSNWLHDKLNVGDMATIGGPQGQFVLDNIDKPIVLLSAGVGITPMISMYRDALQEALRTRERTKVIMFNTFKTLDDMAFKSEIDKLTQAYQGYADARAFWLLTQPEQSAKPGVDFSGAGRLNADMLQSVLPLDKYQFYLCGPAGFMQDTYDLLLSLGVNDTDINAEAFGPGSITRQRPETAREPEAIDIAETAIIQFSQSQVEQAWSKQDGSLLDFAEGHGLQPEFGCRSGSCGSCKVKVKKGEVVHSGADYPLNDNEALLCCAMPKRVAGEIPIVQLEA